MKECLTELSTNYPKQEALEWRVHLVKRHWLVTNDVEYLK